MASHGLLDDGSIARKEGNLLRMFRFMAIDGAPVNQKAGWFVHRNQVFVLIQNGE